MYICVCVYNTNDANGYHWETGDRIRKNLTFYMFSNDNIFNDHKLLL